MQKRIEVDDAVEYRNCHPSDRWVFNKLTVAEKAGWSCGPCGEPIPEDGEYIVRPMMNVLGMSRGARVEVLRKGDVLEEPGYFWCERHVSETQLSIDYARTFGKWEPTLVVLGHRPIHAPLWKFSKWERLGLEDALDAPGWLNTIRHNSMVNVEFVGGKAIEVHLRPNPDFVGSERVLIPIWDDTPYKTSNWRFIEAREWKRVGFMVSD